MDTLDRKRLADLISAVESVLWNDWDPIGVSEFPEARGEYDSYAPPIAGMVWRQESVAKISDYLDWATNDQMGLGGDKALVLAGHEQLAQTLLALR